MKEDIIVHTNYFSGTGHADAFGTLGFFVFLIGILILFFPTIWLFLEKMFVWGSVSATVGAIFVVGAFNLWSISDTLVNVEEQKVHDQLQESGFSDITELNTTSLSGILNGEYVECAVLYENKDTYEVLCDVKSDTN